MVRVAWVLSDSWYIGVSLGGAGFVFIWHSTDPTYTSRHHSVQLCLKPRRNREIRLFIGINWFNDHPLQELSRKTEPSPSNFLH